MPYLILTTLCDRWCHPIYRSVNRRPRSLCNLLKVTHLKQSLDLNLSDPRVQALYSTPSKKEKIPKLIKMVQPEQTSQSHCLAAGTALRKGRRSPAHLPPSRQEYSFQVLVSEMGQAGCHQAGVKEKKKIMSKASPNLRLSHQAALGQGIPTGPTHLS